MFILSVRSRKYEDLYILKDLVSVQDTLSHHHDIELDDPFFYVDCERWIETEGVHVIILQVIPDREVHHEFNL